MKRWLMLLLLLPNCTGCLYYAYPSITQTPELTVKNDDGGAHAFRVEIDRTERKPEPPSTEYTLMRIPMDRRGVIPSQLEVAPTTGVLNPLGWVDGQPHERSQFSLLVRAYRPGFQMIEVKAWEKSRELQWTPAPDLLAQEKAIDDLLADPAAPMPPPMLGRDRGPEMSPSWWEMKDQKSPALGLQPGSVSPSQRSALVFAASEYERLANSPAASTLNLQPHRERLQQKAIWLKRYAEQPPPAR
ncbi:MAG: hypothetical protein EXR98_10120 [Gemmataceae bacterium]|nr:hypothetical protein [Gemmataceae bacterium]